MTLRLELRSALKSWASDGREAAELADQIFASVTAAIRKRFPGLTLIEVELLFGDARRDAEVDLHELLDGTVVLDDAVDAVAARFGDD